MMHFARLMQILTQIFYCLYSFVTSMTNIKASTAFILFLSVFLVLLPINAIHTESDTRRQILNTESENDTKYSVQSTTFKNNPISDGNDIFIIIAVIIYTFLVSICVNWFNQNFQRFNLAHFPQNNNQNNRWIHMNSPIRRQRVARGRILNE